MEVREGLLAVRYKMEGSVRIAFSPGMGVWGNTKTSQHYVIGDGSRNGLYEMCGSIAYGSFRRTVKDKVRLSR